MTREKIFEAWAPPSAIWSPWAKPVLFSQLSLLEAGVPPIAAISEPPIDVTWAADPERRTALVVDLPGAQAISLSPYLAAISYRPIPLYNACPAPPGERALVDIHPIMMALAAVAPMLEGLELPPDAPPAFLLDAARNPPTASPTPSIFDNRSISLPTDFPSAHLLSSRGIRRVVVVQVSRAEPQADLSHSLRRWQEAGLSILAMAMDGTNQPQPIIIQRPKSFRVLWYNLLAKMGLKSNPLGGFGGWLPMPSSG